MADDDEDANDVLRSRGADGLRDAFDRAERKVVPFREVVEPAQPQQLIRWVRDKARWDHIPVPEPDWTVLNRVPRRQVALLSGEGAMGKSTLLLQLCAAHALGRDWLYTMPEPGNAMFLDAEDDQDVLHRRCAAIVRHYGVRFADLDGLDFASLAGQDALLAVANRRSGKVEPTPLYAELLEAVGDVKPVMIGLASAANFFAGNENDRSEVQQFVGLLTRLAIVSNGSVVLISHPSLSGIASGSGMSGSTAWHNSVRARFVLRGVRRDGERTIGEVDDGLREIEFIKNNYGPVAEKVLLRWRDGMFLPVAKPSPLQRAAQDQDDDGLFLELLAVFTDQGRNASVNKGTSYAPFLFGETAKAKAAGVNGLRLKFAMDRLLTAGRIRVTEFGPPSHRRSRLVVT